MDIDARPLMTTDVVGEIDIYASVDSVHPGWSSLEISKKQPKKVILLGK